MRNPNVVNENSNQVRNHSVLPFVNNKNELLLLYLEKIEVLEVSGRFT